MTQDQIDALRSLLLDGVPRQDLPTMMRRRFGHFGVSATSIRRAINKHLPELRHDAPNTFWTPETIGLLRRMIHSGQYSYSDIVLVMNRDHGGQLSRSAISGAVKRYVPIESRPKKHKPKPPVKAKTPRKRTAPLFRLEPSNSIRLRAVPPDLPLPPTMDDPTMCGVRLDGLKRRQCRWPLRGVGEKTMFCEHGAEVGAYCSAHAARAYRLAPEPRREAEFWCL